MRRILATGTGLLLLALAACAQPVPAGDGPGLHGPDDVILRVEYVGGFVTVEHVLTALPVISVYGDGRVVTEGPMIEIYPSPALPNVLVRTITPAGIDRLVRLALDAGVGEADVDYGIPPVADVPSTVFSVRSGGGLVSTQVEALGFGEESLTAPQQAARAPLSKLFEQLQDLPGTLGADAGDDEQPYQPAALAAVSRPWVDPEDGLPAPTEVEWAGPTLPGDPAGEGALGGLGCVTVTGTALDAVLTAAAGANVLTPWASDGQRWSVTFRPLLPDESSCADLAA